MRGGIYPGWYVVGVAGVIFMLLIGTTVGAFGLLVLPVSRDLGLSRADMNTALILLQLGGAAWAPFIGRALDRFPARAILAVAGVAFGISLTILALSHSVWLSALVILVLLPVAESGAGALGFGVIVVRWFLANRGKAMLFFNLGASLSALLVVPVLSLLIQKVGWRATLLASAVIVAAFILGAAYFIKERPSPGEAEAEFQKSSESRGTTNAPSVPHDGAGPARITDILRRPQFWLIALACCLPMGVNIAVAISVYPFAIQMGFSPTEATALLSAMGSSAIAGILLVSLVIDRFDRRLILIGLFLVDAAALAVMPSVASFEFMLPAVVLLGISSGVLLPTMITLQADVFGAPSFGTVRGLMAPLTAVAGGLMVRFAGEVYDRTGDYDLMFYSFIVAEIVSALLIGALLFWRSEGRPRRPELEVQT